MVNNQKTMWTEILNQIRANSQMSVNDVFYQEVESSLGGVTVTMIEANPENLTA